MFAGKDSFLWENRKLLSLKLGMGNKYFEENVGNFMTQCLFRSC